MNKFSYKDKQAEVSCLSRSSGWKVSYIISIMIMVSLIVCLLESISRFFPRSQRSFSRVFNFPPPREFHVTLKESYLENFKEVFIIGDVHGCFDELEMLLDKANVNRDDVLKILVGDLVNKGPKNQEVLNLVRQSKSMLSVRGNHDEIVLNEYFSSKQPGYQLKERNLWIKELSIENVNYLVDLPYTISVPSLNSIIVHAGLLPGLPLAVQKPVDLTKMRNIIVKDYFWDGGLQGSKNTTEGEAWASLWGGPEHVYFGHDAKRMLQKHVNATGLDTGCVYGNWLTGLFISGPRKGAFVEIKAKKVYDDPFEKYA